METFHKIILYNNSPPEDPEHCKLIILAFISGPISKYKKIIWRIANDTESGISATACYPPKEIIVPARACYKNIEKRYLGSNGSS